MSSIINSKDFSVTRYFYLKDCITYSTSQDECYGNHAFSSLELVGKPAISRTSPTIVENITCFVEWVHVAKAVYLRRSMINHSCDPKIHASTELSMGALIDTMDEE